MRPRTPTMDGDQLVPPQSTGIDLTLAAPTHYLEDYTESYHSHSDACYPSRVSCGRSSGYTWAVPPSFFLGVAGATIAH